MVPRGIHRVRAEARLATSRGAIGPLGEEDDIAADALADKIMASLDDPDGVALRRDLEEAGIHGAAVIGLDWGIVEQTRPVMTPEEQLDWFPGFLDQHNGYFSYVFGIDPRREGAAEYLREALSRGAVGLKLYPPAGFSPADPICDPLYEVVAEFGAFTIAHTGWTAFPFDLEYSRVEAYSSVQRKG
jgi:uncharacterized protein